MRKPVMPYTNDKGADQPAHPHSQISTFVVRCVDSIIPLVSISKICRAAEKSKHYLLSCPNYTIIRNQVLNNYLHIMPIKTLLNGDSQLSEEENEHIFNDVQTFIAHSVRFTQGR